MPVSQEVSQLAVSFREFADYLECEPEVAAIDAGADLFVAASALACLPAFELEWRRWAGGNGGGPGDPVSGAGALCAFCCAAARLACRPGRVEPSGAVPS